MKANIWHGLAEPVRGRGWSIESGVRAMAGIIVLASVGLAVFVDLRWLWLTAFVGAN